MKEISFKGDLPERFDEGFALLSDELGMLRAETGFPVRLIRGDELRLKLAPSEAEITWSRRVEVYRALSMLKARIGTEADIVERAAFPHLGVMLDMSRNAVLKPEALEFIFKKLAQMGVDLGMMYTEETYELPGYPYFGYRRGRYTQKELRALDDTADALGIELCPCIQTLGHLNRALHWPQMAHLKDTEEVLLAGDEAVYDFIRAMLKESTAPYRSKRVHVGMDEAHDIGLGRYRRLHGYEEPFSIMKKHLERVNGIIKELGLEAMMWSDMYFRPASPTGGYYDGPTPSKEVAAIAPKDIALVYWDYYHESEEEYDEMFRKHDAIGAKTYFAGGIWTYTGPVPDLDKTVASCVPGLCSAKKRGTELVLAAAWGDNGAEANFITALPAIQVYAEYSYKGRYDEVWTAVRFREVCGADMRAFMDITRLNHVPGVKDWKNVRPVNAAKFLLYEDPIVPLYEADLSHADAAEHYERMAGLMRRCAMENKPYAELFGFYAQLAKVLAVKCGFHAKAGPCVRAGDREGAKKCADIALKTAEELKTLRDEWRALWKSTNRVHGFEVIELRVGGLIARMETAAVMLRAFACGDDEAVAPLLEEPLPYTVLPDGALRGSYAWGEIASACKIDN